ncbi:hypothetical protein [Alistipes sp. i18-0019-D1]|jgi:hypothetical protein|uniref:hypothetical protein n=1 Tax=Alistipes sp. i18-0019-D1 TaxID=3132707 RepID=UPI0036F29CC4
MVRVDCFSDEPSAIGKETVCLNKCAAGMTGGLLREDADAIRWINRGAGRSDAVVSGISTCGTGKRKRMRRLPGMISRLSPDFDANTFDAETSAFSSLHAGFI